MTRSVFTDDVLEKIPQLVAEQYTREEIADKLSLTLGSLKVTCSRMGMSLRVRVPTGKAKRAVLLSKDADRRLASFAVEHDVSVSVLCAALLERIAMDNIINAVLDEGDGK